MKTNTQHVPCKRIVWYTIDTGKTAHKHPAPSTGDWEKCIYYPGAPLTKSPAPALMEAP
jgi:hypothetical protein